MRFRRHSRRRSSRGHVRVEQGPNWVSWVAGGVTLVLMVITMIVVVTQVVLPLFDEESQPVENRTWLEFEWTRAPINQTAVEQLAQRLEAHAINRVYLEASAWRNDGTLIEGEYAAEFVTELHNASPEMMVLLWLRMSGEEIAQSERRAAVVSLAQKAVRQWGFDGVQLNGRTVYKDSDSFVQLVRDLRAAIGDQALLSVTVPPDRIPSDPDVPIGSTLDADLTWDLDYKQRVRLLGVDEFVVMAYASGLADSAQYSVWVGYQITSYAGALADLDDPAELVIALATYDAAPEHDPVVESIPAAVAGVKSGIARLGDQGNLVRGIGLYEYKTTDSLEWALFGEQWPNHPSG